MLKRTNQNARFCYERAIEAAQQAATARTPMDREFWLEREKQWIHLSASYNYQERLAAFNQGLRTLPKRPICSVCDLPMQAKRLQCRRTGLLEFDYECRACEAKQTVVEIDAKPLRL